MSRKHFSIVVVFAVACFVLFCFKTENGSLRRLCVGNCRFRLQSLAVFLSVSPPPPPPLSLSPVFSLCLPPVFSSLSLSPPCLPPPHPAHSLYDWTAPVSVFSHWRTIMTKPVTSLSPRLTVAADGFQQRLVQHTGCDDDVSE